MDDGLKQRLVGAIVLIAIAVIFLPALLKEPQLGGASKPPVVLPSKTKFEVVSSLVSNSEQAQATMRARLEQERAAYDPVGPHSASNSKQGVVVKPDPGSQRVESKQSSIQSLRHSAPPIAPSWSVQLASFSQKDNAEKLKVKLLIENYSAYSRVSTQGDEPIYRVYVGPEIKKDRAEQNLAKLKKNFNLEGLIVRFHP